MNLKTDNNFKSGLYVGIAYNLINNNPGPGKTQIVAGLCHNPSEDIPYLSPLVPALQEADWDNSEVFDRDLFHKAFYYCYSGDEPNTSLYYELTQDNEALHIEIRSTEDDEEIPEGFGGYTDIFD